MPNPQNRRRHEQPSTYVVQDRELKDELIRLTIQDRLVTTAMGGPLPEQPDPTVFRRVLDIGCGPGGWAVEAAQAYSTMSLVGIDISQRMIDYARTQAEAQHVADRVEFYVMDALRALEFPAGFFDLVNLRFGVSFLRTWDWSKLLSEMLRVTRSGGVVRVTDQELIHQGSGSAGTQFTEMVVCALFRAGHLFEQESTGLTAHLARLLTQNGCRQVQTKTYPLEYRTGTPEGQMYYEDGLRGVQTLRPFIQKWGCISGDYEALCQQAFDDVRQPGYRATWNILSAWGTV